MGTQDPPLCVVQESPDQVPPILIPYPPNSSSTSDTVSSPGEDPLSQEASVSDAISNIMTDLAIAGNKDYLTSSKHLHALDATHRELTFLLDTECPGRASPRDTC